MEEDSLTLNLTHEIPLDLLLDILPRLPAKTLIRFQSVSKLWHSIIRSKDLAKSFLTHAKTRPRLFFLLRDYDSNIQFIFSAPEHNNKNNNSVVARHDMTISGLVYDIRSCPVNGFFCCTRGSSIRLCNPTTRQIVNLPDIVGLGRENITLGYDPVEDQYKVLCVITYIRQRMIVHEHLVCTVKSGEAKEWRKIETIPRKPYSNIKDGICIDGVIYFGVDYSKPIARFDVRTESIDFIQAPDGFNGFLTNSRLINCNGKLGAIKYDTKMHLWILNKEECTWNYVANHESRECFVGEIHTGELMWVYRRLQAFRPFSVYYCDFATNSFRSGQVVGIADRELRCRHGIDHDYWRMLCYPGHVENITFL